MSNQSWKNRNKDYKVANNLRTRLNAAIRKKVKSGSAVKDLGCSIPEFMIYMESLFEKGMTWENHGKDGWHIDHIIPLSFFDLEDREQFLQACHYSNLQPMWAKDNLKKGANIGKKIKSAMPVLKLRKTKFINKEFLVELVESGKSSREIAILMKCSPGKIQYWMNKFDIKSNFPKQKEYFCKCGESNKNKFYKNRKSICKKCRNEYIRKLKNSRLLTV